MADVFISYHEETAGELVAQIADVLENAGISCWYAKRDIPPGGDFARYIPPQIDACKIFLLILNENVYQSNHIENEVGLAFGRLNKGENITILPLEIGNFKRESWVKYYLVHTQSVGLPLLNEAQLKLLTEKVFDILDLLSPSMPLKSQKVLKSGVCGKNVTYTLFENGELKILGSGSIKPMPFTMNTPWWNERSMISFVDIGYGITSIGMFVFTGCSSLIGVNIPDSVTSIGWYAFGGCTKLNNVNVSAHTKIANNAFPETTSIIRRA